MGLPLKLGVQGQGGGKILDLAEQREWEVRGLEFDKFHGSQMCIVP